MGRIYTSYFYMAHLFDKEHYILVAINTNSYIKHLIDYKFTNLVPSYEDIQSLRDGLITEDMFKADYINRLNNLGFQVINDVFNKMWSDEGENKDIILLCYENPFKFCHRHVFAEWYNSHAGKEVITEYKFDYDKIRGQKVDDPDGVVLQL